MGDTTQQRLEKYLRESEYLKREARRQRSMADECREDLERLIDETMDVWRSVQAKRMELHVRMADLHGDDESE